MIHGTCRDAVLPKARTKPEQIACDHVSRGEEGLTTLCDAGAMTSKLIEYLRWSISDLLLSGEQLGPVL